MIFLDFLKVKIYENMLQNAPNCTIKIFLGGSMPPNPPSKRVATPPVETTYPPPPLLRNLFENPPWQTVDCG